MEEDLRALLLADAAVAASVGSRVFWVSRQQGSALPALVLNVISGAEGRTMQGPDSVWTGRVQVDCYGASVTDAKVLARAAVAALNGYRQDRFRGVFHEATRDGREGGSNEADRPFRVSVDFMVNWRAD